MLFLDQNSKFHGIKELQVPKMAPPSPKNAFFGPKKNFENFFRKFVPKQDVWHQNQLSIIYRSQVMAKNDQKWPKMVLLANFDNF